MTNETPVSPKITGTSWGHIEVDGQERFKDVKLYPGGAREWDWTETGTSHSPGIQPEDVAELVENGSRTVILSRGMYGRLEVLPQTLDFLSRKGVKTHVLKTPEAARLYNQLREREPVGGLFHTTC